MNGKEISSSYKGPTDTPQPIPAWALPKTILVARCVCGEDVFSDDGKKAEDCGACGRSMCAEQFEKKEIANVLSEKHADCGRVDADGNDLTCPEHQGPEAKVEMYNQNSLVEPPRCWYGTWGHGHYCGCGRSLVRHYSKMWGTAEECRMMMADRWGQKWSTTYDGGSGEYTQRPAWLDEYGMTILPQRCWEGKCGQEKSLGLDANGNENF